MTSSRASEWMPFYGRDFFRSERVLAMESAARLLYLEALWREWEEGSLPSDPRILRALFPSFGDQFEVLWAQVLPCFTVRPSDGRLVNDRCETERGKWTEIVERRRNAGRTGGLASGNARASKRSTVVERSSNGRQAQTGPDQTRQESETPPTPLAGGRPPRKRRVEPVPWTSILAREQYARLRDNPAFMTAWNEWIAHSREAGTKAREPRGSQAAAMLNEAHRVGPAMYAAAIRMAIAGNWQGVHVDAVKRAQASSPSANGDVRSKSDILTQRAIDRARADGLLPPADSGDEFAAFRTIDATSTSA